MEYTQLDTATRLAAIKNRRRELEQQYMQIELRVTAPDVNNPTNERDSSNLAMLETSLARLQEMENQLNPPAPATA